MRQVTGSAHKDGGFLTLQVKSLQALQSLYMPFIRNGGLFIPSTRHYQLGEPVFVLLSLPGDAQPTPVAGHVVWITPSGSQSTKRGIGLQLSTQDGGALHNRLQSLLAPGGLREDRRYTL